MAIGKDDASPDPGRLALLGDTHVETREPSIMDGRNETQVE